MSSQVLNCLFLQTNNLQQLQLARHDAEKKARDLTMQLADLLMDADNVISSEGQHSVQDRRNVEPHGEELALLKSRVTEMALQGLREERGHRTSADPEQQQGTPDTGSASVGGDQITKSVGIVTQRCVKHVCINLIGFAIK